MGLRDLRIKISYNSGKEDVVESYLNPALKEAILYERVAAYYSSSSLKKISEGLSELLWSGGEARFIVSILVSKEDYNAILESRKNPIRLIEELFPSKEELKKMMENNSIEAFAKLLASGKLKMKFAISSTGLFHPKFGIIKDSNEDGIAFVGSLNETLEGIKFNIEIIDVFKSWEVGQREYYEHHRKEFENYWNKNIGPQIKIYDMPDNVANIIYAAYSEHIKEKDRKQNAYALRPYQNDAVKFLAEHNYIGLLEMATGTGKTKTAIECAKNVINIEGGNVAIIIAVPTKIIGEQWKKSWHEYFHEWPYLIDVNKSNSKEDLYVLASSNISKKVIIGTYSYISRGFFMNKIIPAIKGKKMLIADEAHWLGASKYSNIMQHGYDYRIGLSATPQRWFDEEGTEAILKFFGNGSIFSYSLSQAISDGYLSEYYYHPFYCQLSEDEIESYTKLTKEFASNYYKIKHKSYIEDENDLNDSGKVPQYLEEILYKRASIIKKAIGKMDILEKIIKNLRDEGKLKSLIVYFADSSQIIQARKILDSFSVKYMEITNETKEKDRENIVNDLVKGNIDCILAMRILDEGVDIPEAEREIIISSTSNPRQYIQRAGRILRKSGQKSHAEIYDILVYAPLEKVPYWLIPSEKKAVSKEIRRARYFCEPALNNAECIDSLYNFSKKFDISIWNT